MGNALTFILKLQDMLTPGMRQAAAISQTSSNRITAEFERINRGGKRMNTSVDELRARLAAINKVRFSTTVEREFNIATKAANKLERQLDKLENKGKSRSGGGGLRSLLGGRFGAAAMIAGGMALATSSVHAAMNYGATTKSFEVLTGSAQKGRELAGNLNELQQKTILGPEVFQSAQTLMGFGVAADKVMKIEKQLGDVSMGNKEKFQALTLAFSQTQAAGKLMGQDLLQYINAGFNPLQTMSEKWKEFGFKQKVTVGQLKDMMEKGTISSQMVAKSFELATSKGGKFANMMDSIAQTSYGQMQILQGSWENFKIQAGNALMPIANGLMDVASKTLDWLNISKTVPQTLMAEQSEVSSLIGVITNLNQGNDLRTRLLQQLNVKYPDLFKNIDVEKVKNNELLTLLNRVNDAYNKRIGLATSQLIVDENKKVLQESQSEFTRYSTMVELLKRGDAASMDTFKKLRSFTERFTEPITGGRQGQIQYYQRLAGINNNRLNNSQQAINKENQSIATQNFVNPIDTAYKLAHDPRQWEQVFGKDYKRRKEFLKLAHQITKHGNNYNTNGGGMAYANQLSALINPESVSQNQNDSGSGGTVAPGKSRADSINNGGQRVITINIGKQIEKMEVHVLGDKEAGKEVEDAMREALRRVVNSMNGIVS